MLIVLFYDAYCRATATKVSFSTAVSISVLLSVCVSFYCLTVSLKHSLQGPYLVLHGLWYACSEPLYTDTRTTTRTSPLTYPPSVDDLEIIEIDSDSDDHSGSFVPVSASRRGSPYIGSHSPKRQSDSKASFLPPASPPRLPSSVTSSSPPSSSCSPTCSEEPVIVTLGSRVSTPSDTGHELSSDSSDKSVSSRSRSPMPFFELPVFRPPQLQFRLPEAYSWRNFSNSGSDDSDEESDFNSENFDLHILTSSFA